MLGGFGALCCFAACTGVGLMARDRCRERLDALMAWTDALSAMRLLFREERLPMDELLLECAKAADSHGAAGKVRQRLQGAGRGLALEPSLTVAEAYGRACRDTPLPAEGQEEKSALDVLFRQLGSGTAAMREQAAAGCLRRLALTVEKAREKAEKSGQLYAKLGALGGLMLAIALW